MVPNEGVGEKVADQPQRRRFTPEYKLRILQEIDSRKDEGHGVVGAILRREGLYASQVASWRNTLEEVIANGLPERKRGRKKDPALAYKQENEKLLRQLLRLKEDLRQARLIIDAQKKIAEMYPVSRQQDGSADEGV
jgi:transposase-like protein